MSVSPRLDRVLLAEVFKDPRLIAAFEQMFELLETTVAQAQAVIAANAAVQAAPVLLTSASDAFGAGSVIQAGAGIDVAAVDGAVTVAAGSTIPKIDGGKSVRFVVTDDTTLLLPRTGTLATIAEVQAMTVTVLEGDKGDITVTDDGATWTIDSSVISTFGRTLTAAADAAAARAVIGAAASAHTHIIADVTGLQAALDAKLDDSQATAFGLSLLDDADAAAGRSTLALGDMATQNANAAAITGGTVNDISSLRVTATNPSVTLKDSDTAGTNATGFLNIWDSANAVRGRIGKVFADGVFYLDNTDAGFRFTIGGSTRVFLDTTNSRLDLNSGYEIRINSQTVLKGRLAALPADATDLATVITLANAIKARMKTTGGMGFVAD